MAVDLSRFSKKTASKQRVASKKETSVAIKQDVKNGPSPKIDPLSNIRSKPHEERILFANGPKVQVIMGEVVISTVPKYVLMQCSVKAFKQFSESSDGPSFTLPAGSKDAGAAAAHLTWMKEMTYQGRVYSLTLRPNEKTMTRISRSVVPREFTVSIICTSPISPKPFATASAPTQLRMSSCP